MACAGRQRILHGQPSTRLAKYHNGGRGERGNAQNHRQQEWAIAMPVYSERTWESRRIASDCIGKRSYGASAHSRGITMDRGLKVSAQMLSTYCAEVKL